MKEDQKKTKKLATYSVIMLLAAIIIIIIAAMADNREEMFQTQIDSTTQTNMTIQNEIVALKDENYILKQENDKLQYVITECAAYENVSKIISEAFVLYESNKRDSARAKLAEINKEGLPAASLSLIDSAERIINKGK